jgi:2-polyprenyl-3-methyl-5-hydroxy-6-metoxy-1,4-benzoquinol methylase
MYKLYLLLSRFNRADQTEGRMIEYAFILKNIIQEAKLNARILLVGCAGDVLSTILPVLGYKVIGLDVKYVPLKYQGFIFTQQDIRNTSFLDNYFDVVVAVSTIEHVGLLDGDVKGDVQALNEIHRILKPQGILLMTTTYSAKYKQTTTERIYDLPHINSLLAKFKIEVLEVYIVDKSGMWSKSDPFNVNGCKVTPFVAIKARKT